MRMPHFDPRFRIGADPALSQEEAPAANSADVTVDATVVPATPVDKLQRRNISVMGYADVTDLLQLFSHATPVRRIADSIMSGAHTPADSVEPLFTALACNDTRYWHERVVAAWALGRINLTPDQRDAAHSMLEECLDTPFRSWAFRKFRRGLYWSLFAATPLSSLTYLLSYAGGPETAFAGFFGIMAVMTCVGSVVFVPLSMLLGTRDTDADIRLRATALESLGHVGGAECIGTLASALFDSGRAMEVAASDALHRLLPQVGPQDLGRLTTNDVRSLSRVLDHTDSLLVYKALSAIEHAGTAEALPYVQRVSIIGKTARIRDRALMVMETLESRRLSAAHASQLMRGAAPAVSIEDNLLRPTLTVSKEDPVQLLRPGVGVENES